MVRVIRCHLLNMKTNIINGSEGPGLSVAIQTKSVLFMILFWPVNCPLLPLFASRHFRIAVAPGAYLYYGNFINFKNLIRQRESPQRQQRQRADTEL